MVLTYHEVVTALRAEGAPPGPYMYVLSQWQLDDLRHEWLIGDEGDAAVTAAAAAYHETECVYHTERDGLLAEVENLRITAREDKRVMDRDAAEIERYWIEADDAHVAVAHAVHERDALAAEVERLHSWAGLMELLDEHWPADIWPMLEDDRKADAGHRVTSAMRWINQLRVERDALAATLARVKVEGDRWANSKNYTSQFAGGLIREALRPKGADDE